LSVGNLVKSGIIIALSVAGEHVWRARVLDASILMVEVKKHTRIK